MGARNMPDWVEDLDGNTAKPWPLRSTRMTYYVWHDDGCCDNSTDYLAQAREIRQQLLADGHSDAYITDSDHNVVDDDYMECSFCEQRAVALLPQSSDQGKTISMVHCCGAHRVDWWDGADWDGRDLEVDLRRVLPCRRPARDAVRAGGVTPPSVTQ